MAFRCMAGRLFSMTKRASPRAKKVWKRIYLREWRKYRGLSTEKLASEAGVSPGLISQIENGESGGSPDSLEKLAIALQIQVGELLDIRPRAGGSVLRVWVNDNDRARVRAIVAALTPESQSR